MYLDVCSAILVKPRANLRSTAGDADVVSYITFALYLQHVSQS